MHHQAVSLIPTTNTTIQIQVALSGPCQVHGAELLVLTRQQQQLLLLLLPWQELQRMPVSALLLLCQVLLRLGRCVLAAALVAAV
jgi:hypothetical protein